MTSLAARLLAFALYFASMNSSIVARQSDRHHCASEALQQIVSEPQTKARGYLETVADAFSIGSALLFGPDSDAYIADFVQKWGVSVSVADASNICSVVSSCRSVTVADISTGGMGTFQFTVSEDISIDKLTVYISSSTPVAGEGLGFFTLGHNAAFVQLTEQSICYGSNPQGSFSIGFSDGSSVLASEFDCQSPDQGTVIKSFQSLAAFSGMSMAGGWSVQAGMASDLQAITITLQTCTATHRCSRDVMRALMNVPGFRYDPSTRMAYYTQDIYDCAGNFRQITISRPIDNLFK